MQHAKIAAIFLQAPFAGLVETRHAPTHRSKCKTYFGFISINNKTCCVCLKVNDFQRV